MKTTSTVTYLDKELISSNSFHTLGAGTTTVTIAYGEEKIFIEFIVSEVENQESNKMWGQVISSDRLQVHLLNFRQLIPTQPLGPFELGVMGGRPLTIVVEATGVRNTPCKHVSYTLYMGGVSG